MATKLTKGKMYLFEWNDTYNFVGWHYDEAIAEKEVKTFQKTLGFFVKQSKTFFILATHHNLNVELGFPEWGTLSYIPMGSVKRITSVS